MHVYIIYVYVWTWARWKNIWLALISLIFLCINLCIVFFPILFLKSNNRLFRCDYQNDWLVMQHKLNCIGRLHPNQSMSHGHRVVLSSDCIYLWMYMYNRWTINIKAKNIRTRVDLCEKTERLNNWPGHHSLSFKVFSANPIILISISSERPNYKIICHFDDFYYHWKLFKLQELENIRVLEFCIRQVFWKNTSP